jgi:hypothetical protein
MGNRGLSVRRLLALALALAMALTMFSLAGCGGSAEDGGESGEAKKPAAETTEVSDAPEDILDAKSDELTDEKSSANKDGGANLVGAMTSSDVAELVKKNPVIEGKWVNHIYFGVAGRGEKLNGLSGVNLAVARALAKAQRNEGKNVDYKAHYVDLNSGCNGNYIAAVNTFTTDKSKALVGLRLAVCVKSGVANFSWDGITYRCFDDTVLNVGVGGRYIYLLEGQEGSKNYLKEIGFYAAGDNNGDTSLTDVWNGITATVFPGQSYNPFSKTWKYVTDVGAEGKAGQSGPDRAVDINYKAEGDYIYMQGRYEW